jgi:hypothetical protein
MLLDAKYVMDNVLPDLKDLYEMVPVMLHPNLEQFIKDFKSNLAGYDVSGRYVEK